MVERRQEPRARSMFKSAYVQTEGGLHFVTLRNISDSGVCLDAFPGVSPGDEVQFCFDSTGLKAGTVRWVKDGLCGIVASGGEALEIAPQEFPARSVRLPLSVKVRLFVDGSGEQATLHNISIRGACVSSRRVVIPGQLVSLEFCGFSIELANVRWVKHDLFGLRFVQPIHPSVFREIVAKIQKIRFSDFVTPEDINYAA